jgi:hypothetical protein
LRAVRRLLLLAIVAVASIVPRAAGAHPIHTTITELTSARDGSVTIRVRSFVDDFSAAVARYARRTPPTDFAVSDGEAARYTGDALQLRDARGKPIRLRFLSQRRTGDVVWLELRAERAVSLTGLRVLNTMLFEVHADQVNIVRATYGSVQHTTLFSRGDREKALP